MKGALVLLAMASLAAASLPLAAQEPPAEPGQGAFAVRVHALVPPPDGAQNSKAAWQEDNVKYTAPGVPVGVKLIGTNVVIMTQVTPFDRGDGTLTLVAQGQVWVRSALGGLSYRTTLDTIIVSLGDTVFFYPLGLSPEGKAPLRIEITVSRPGKDGPVAPPALDALPGQAAGQGPGAAQGEAKPKR